jgi:hypothetical protein
MLVVLVVAPAGLLRDQAAVVSQVEQEQDQRVRTGPPTPGRRRTVDLARNLNGGQLPRLDEMLTRKHDRS